MLKNEFRKEIRKTLKGSVTPIDSIPPFESNARQLWVIDDTTGRIAHQVRASIRNRIIKKSDNYQEILALMRDKEADKKETAKLIDKAIKDLGYTEVMITALRDEELATNYTYQALTIAKVEAEKLLKISLENMPIWNNYLEKVTGVGVLTASKLLYEVGDVTRFSQPSKLTKYCGLAVDPDGSPQRQHRGQTCDYKPSLKALLLGVIGDNFIKSCSEYRRIYDERRKYTSKYRPEWGVHPHGKKKEYLAHYHADATRCMVKRFLIEFWKAGWYASDLEPPTKPYAVNILGHDEEPDIVPYG